MRTAPLHVEQSVLDDLHRRLKRTRLPAPLGDVPRLMLEGFKTSGRVSVPAPLAVFPQDLTHPPRERADRFYDVQRYTEFPRGGHFAAHEEPELLANDLKQLLLPRALSRLTVATRAAVPTSG